MSKRKGLRWPAAGLLPDGYSRLSGTPRFYKGDAKVFSCQSNGVRGLTLQKRAAPDLFKVQGPKEWSARSGLSIGSLKTE